jgi:hypothetical protein
VSARVLNPLTKRMENTSTQINIIRCSDLIFAILEFKHLIIPKIPKIMQHYKKELHDLTTIDDALHLMQFMLMLDPEIGLMKRCDPDPDHYSDFSSKDAQRPKNVV